MDPLANFFIQMARQHTIHIGLYLLAIILSAFMAACRPDGHIHAGIDRPLSDIGHLRAEGMTALNRADFDSAIICGHRLLEIADKSHGRPAQEADIYGNLILGQGFLFNDSVGHSYRHLHEAELLCLKYGNDSALASVYNGLGLYASNIEKDFPGALRHFFNGLDAAKRSANERLHSLLLVNIASIYSLNDDPAGLRYALECYRHGKQNKDNFLRYTGAMTAAYSYALRKTDTSKALDYIREAEIILHSDSIRDGSSLYYIYGVLLRQQGRDSEAVECFRQSIDLLKANHNEGDVRSFIEYADILFSKHRHSEALALLDSALQVTDGGHCGIFRQDVLKALASTNRKLGNIQLAKQYLSIADNENNIDDNAEKESVIEHIKSKYDLERADNEVNRQRVELLEKERIVNFLIAAIAIAIVLSGSFIYLYRRKSRLYSAIVKQATEAAREEIRLRATIRQLEERLSSGSFQEQGKINDAGFPDDHDGQMADTNVGTAVGADSSSPKKSPIPDRLIVAFESLMLDPAIYTDNLISKDKIAQMLDTNRTYVSRLVNEVYGMTFPQFINSLRAKEAIRRLSDPECDTPLKALSSELGYNSMTTFYNKFSEATGMTPAAFREKSRSIATGQTSDVDSDKS